MLHNQKIVFVSIVDNKSTTSEHFKTRIWHHQKLVDKLLKNEACVIGKKTFDLTRWKGPNVWVLTTDRKWRRTGVGTIHHLDDLYRDYSSLRRFLQGTIHH